MKSRSQQKMKERMALVRSYKKSSKRMKQDSLLLLDLRTNEHSRKKQLTTGKPKQKTKKKLVWRNQSNDVEMRKRGLLDIRYIPSRADEMARAR